MAGTTTDDRLLRAIAEQLKLPLLQIARLSELRQASPQTADLQSISYVAETALRILDSFLLSADRQAQEVFQLEPVSVASVLHETAHQLAPLARQNDCDLELSLSGRYGPVMAHRQSLESALLLLGYGMIETRTAESARHRVVLAAHRSAHGLVAGVFDNQPGLSTDMLRRGRALLGGAKQAMPTATGSNGASVFVADALFKTMESSLRVARHNKFTGLAATLHPSAQLSLV